MKFGIFVLSSILFSSSIFAMKIESQKSNVNIARVVSVNTLVSKPGIQVSVAVEDLGGSTDVSPTQTAYLTLYSKGEMYSTDATFNLGSYFAVKGASRVAAGLYKLVVVDAQTLKDVVISIDARQATSEIQKVSCDDFDCEASRDFKATIDVSLK